MAKRKKEALAPEGKLLDFARWYFPEREGMEFIEGPHHRVIGETLDRVLAGEIARLIITPSMRHLERVMLRRMGRA